MKIKEWRKTAMALIAGLFVLAGTASAQSTVQRLQQITRSYFAQKLQVAASDIDVSFKHLPAHPEKYMHSKIQVFSQRNTLTPGYQSLWVVFSSGEGHLQKKMVIAADVVLKRKILVAAVPIRRGMRLEPGMVRIEQRRLGKDWENYYADQNALSGLEAKQTIKSGRAITRRLLRRVPLMHRGDRVKVEVRHRLLSVSTYGTAIQDGFKDEKIRLKLEATGQIIRAKVSSAGLAVLEQ